MSFIWSLDCSLVWEIFFFSKDGPFPASYSLFLSFLRIQLVGIILLMLGFNSKSLVLEATAQPTEPQPLPIVREILISSEWDKKLLNTNNIGHLIGFKVNTHILCRNGLRSNLSDSRFKRPLTGSTDKSRCSTERERLGTVFKVGNYVQGWELYLKMGTLNQPNWQLRFMQWKLP